MPRQNKTRCPFIKVATHSQSHQLMPHTRLSFAKWGVRELAPLNWLVRVKKLFTLRVWALLPALHHLNNLKDRLAFIAQYSGCFPCSQSSSQVASALSVCVAASHLRLNRNTHFTWVSFHPLVPSTFSGFILNLRNMVSDPQDKSLVQQPFILSHFRIPHDVPMPVLGLGRKPKNLEVNPRVDPTNRTRNCPAAS